MGAMSSTEGNVNLTRRHRRPKVAAAALTLVAALAGSCAGLRPPRLATDQPHCFRVERLVDSDDLLLLPDSSYRRIRHFHLYASTFDYGTWSQADDGTLWLTSKEMVRDLQQKVRGGKLVIYGNDQRMLETRAALEQFLSQHSEKKFSPEAVEQMLMWDPAFGTGKDHAISVDTAGKAIRRTDLEAFRSALAAFVESPERNRYALTPWNFQGMLVLLWKQGGVLDGEEGFMSIDANECIAGETETHPFLFVEPSEEKAPP